MQMSWKSLSFANCVDARDRSSNHGRSLVAMKQLGRLFVLARRFVRRSVRPQAEAQLALFGQLVATTLVVSRVSVCIFVRSSPSQHLGLVVIRIVPSLQQRRLERSGNLLEANLKVDGEIPLGQKVDVTLVNAQSLHRCLGRAQS